MHISEITHVSRPSIYSYLRSMMWATRELRHLFPQLRDMERCGIWSGTAYVSLLYKKPYAECKQVAFQYCVEYYSYLQNTWWWLEVCPSCSMTVRSLVVEKCIGGKGDNAKLRGSTVYERKLPPSIEHFPWHNSCSKVLHWSCHERRKIAHRMIPRIVMHLLSSLTYCIWRSFPRGLYKSSSRWNVVKNDVMLLLQLILKAIEAPSPSRLYLTAKH